MKLIVFGATGTVGRVLVAQALEAGHQVTAFTRSGRVDGPQHDNLRVVRGDVLDPGAVSRAISGQEAVLCALGAGRKGGVRAPGTANIIAGMKENGVRRLICQSTLGAGDSEGNLTFFWKYIMFGMFLRPAYIDHQIQEQHVRASGLDWTIVRPAAFTDGPRTGTYQHGFSSTASSRLKLKISRADIADFMIAQLRSDTYLQKAPGLSY